MTVSPERLAILARGINADNVTFTSRLAPYAPADIAIIKAMGFTYVRVPVELSWIMPDLPTPEGQVSSAARVTVGLQRLGDALKAFTDAEIAVMPTVFVNPAIYALPNAQDIITQGAVLLAQRYAPLYCQHLLFLGTLNEPQFAPADWDVFAPKLVSAVRAVAPKHTMIVEFAGHSLAANAAALSLIPDDNIVYSMHVYQPGKMTQQGAGGGMWPDFRFPAPDGTPGKTGMFTLAKMESYFRTGPDWATANNVPLIVGEFGTTKLGDHASWTAWARCIRALADKYQIGWAWWAYDGRLFGLNPHGTGVDPDLAAILGKQP